ncbi:unnamed protein product, partial [Effrenium voratum]
MPQACRAPRLRPCRRAGSSGPSHEGLQLDGGNSSLATREEIEERLGSLRAKMESIRSGDAGCMQRSYKGADLRGRVLWCDSDEKVGAEAQVLLGSGLDLDTFQEPEALLQRYLESPHDVLCIMSSMMEGNGRKEGR